MSVCFFAAKASAQNVLNVCFFCCSKKWSKGCS